MTGVYKFGLGVSAYIRSFRDPARLWAWPAGIWPASLCAQLGSGKPVGLASPDPAGLWPWPAAIRPASGPGQLGSGQPSWDLDPPGLQSRAAFLVRGALRTERAVMAKEKGHMSQPARLLLAKSYECHKDLFSRRQKSADVSARIPNSKKTTKSEIKKQNRKKIELAKKNSTGFP